MLAVTSATDRAPNKGLFRRSYSGRFFSKIEYEYTEIATLINNIKKSFSIFNSPLLFLIHITISIRVV